MPWQARLAKKQPAVDPHPWRETGHPWLNRRVLRVGRRANGSRWVVHGRVTGWIPADDDDEALWRVDHDDGDREDLDEAEVSASLAAIARWYTELSERGKLRVMRNFPGYGGWIEGYAVAMAEGSVAGAVDRTSEQWLVTFSDGSSKQLDTASLELGLAAFDSRAKKPRTAASMTAAHQSVLFAVPNVVASSAQTDYPSRSPEKTARKRRRPIMFQESSDECSNDQVVLRVEERLEVEPRLPDPPLFIPAAESTSTDDDTDRDPRIGDAVGRFFPGFGWYQGAVTAERSVPRPDSDPVTTDGAANVSILFLVTFSDGDAGEYSRDEVVSMRRNGQRKSEVARVGNALFYGGLSVHCSISLTAVVRPLARFAKPTRRHWRCC